MGNEQNVCKMEQFVIPGIRADAFDHDIASEEVRLEVKHIPGCLRAEVYVREGNESLLSVYSITGQLRFRKWILTPGDHEFTVDLKNGVYVATLISGKNWAAKRLTVK